MSLLTVRRGLGAHRLLFCLLACFLALGSPLVWTSLRVIHAHGGGEGDSFNDDDDDDDDDGDDSGGGDSDGDGDDDDDAGSGDGDDDDDGGPPCLSTDPTNSPGCYKHRSDAELELLLRGTAVHPFAAPRACGETVDTPAEARAILGGGGSSPCAKFRRDVLAAIFNIRRSILFGDGRLGEDGARCFGVAPFCIVLRCGNVFIPDPGTPDPTDAKSVTARTPLAELVELANQLCEAASCPSSSDAACGKTLVSLAWILNQVNESASRLGECGLCKGDITPPQITCPTGTLELECTGPDGAQIQYTVSASDNCDPAPEVSCFPPPGTVLPTGSWRTVECRAKDMSGNMATCTFEVKVVDRAPPDITCPDGPIVVDCVPGGRNGAEVNYPAPGASDLCDDDPEVICDPPSGSFFPFGTTTVRCTATDVSGNSSLCEFDVMVVEDTPPGLVCPADITAECEGPGGAVVEYPPPMVTSTCDPPPAPSCDPPSGSLFPIGSTTVTCRTVDARGNPIECRFTVTVRDTRDPRIVCPADMTVECAGPQGTVVSYEVTAEDTCDETPTIVCDPPSGASFPSGESIVTCSATDAAGNSSSCSFKVTVTDSRPPVITCPEPIRVAACSAGGGGAGTVVNYPDPMVRDDCDGAPAVRCEPPSGSFFLLGKTTVTCTATDGAGNPASCSFEVEVVDTAPPTLVCVEDFSVECTGPDGAVVTYSEPVVADDCDADPAVTCDPPSGSRFPFGTTTVTCTAADDSGNEMQCSFDVTVEDTKGPEIACPADKIVECETTEGTRVEYEVTATDVCDPEPAVTCDPPSGTFFKPGLTVVECVATDAFGNRGVCRFSVSVVDTRPPIIECPADITAECSSPAGAPVSYTASAVDACGAPVLLSCDPPPGSTFPPGTTEVVCVATDDAQNSSECRFRITVADTQPPSITCPQEVVTIECTGGGSARASYPPPVVEDGCDADPTVACDPPPDTVLPVGSHLITCTATDDSGNTARCSFEVHVVDTAPPMLNCIGDITRECDGPDGTVVTYELPTPSDTCDPAPNLSCLPASGSLFPIGETTVTCTADDQEGNMIQCTFKVIVVDSMPPLITCPPDIVVPCSSADGAIVSYTTTATDGCDPNPVVTCIPPSGHKFPVGTTEVTCRAEDRAGNESICVFQVTVLDESPPLITCPESFETACDEGGTALVEYPAPHATDGCDPEPEVTCTPPSGSRLPPGTHTIVCKAVDSAGNDSTCEFTVRVTQSTPAALVCPPDIAVECEGPDGAVVKYPLPMANDACGGHRTVTCVPPSGSRFPLGQTEVVCTAGNDMGDMVQCTFRVTVRDTTPPEVVCPASIVAEAESPQGAHVEYTVGVSDTCDPSATLTCVPPSGSLFPMGETTVTCRAVDAAGNDGACSFTITVVDRTPPNLTCPVDLRVEGTTAGTPPHKPPGWPPGSNPPANAITAVVVYPEAAATDSGQTEPPQITSSPPSGTRLGFGRHVITCTARDRAGNEATCTFEVNVVLGAHAFVRPDANADSLVDIADPITVVNHLFLGGFEPKCMDAADANDDGKVDISDVIYALNYIFMGGPRPPDPFPPLCGLDPTDSDTLGCERFPPCE